MSTWFQGRIRTVREREVTEEYKPTHFCCQAQTGHINILSTLFPLINVTTFCPLTCRDTLSGTITACQHLLIILPTFFPLSSHCNNWSKTKLDNINIHSTYIVPPLNILPRFYQLVSWAGNLKRKLSVVDKWLAKCGEPLGKLWGWISCGSGIDHILIGCGEYVDFIPKCYPHILFPA